MANLIGYAVSTLIPGVNSLSDTHPFPIIKSSNIFRADLDGSSTAFHVQWLTTLWRVVTGGSRTISGGQTKGAGGFGTHTRRNGIVRYTPISYYKKLEYI